MNKLRDVYERLYRAFGPQQWWPGETPFEVAVGAILTQNTNWTNVEKAIENLRRNKTLSARAIYEMPVRRLSELIRPSGYFNIKAARLKSFMEFLTNSYGGSMKKMKGGDIDSLRQELLHTKGIGPETADSILLYALDKPVFVIDAYTKRVLSRHVIMDFDRSYKEFQDLFHSTLGRNLKLFNEFHALFVKVGKMYCKRRNPLCSACPLSGLTPITIARDNA